MEFWKEVRRRVLTKEISKRAACETYFCVSRFHPRRQPGVCFWWWRVVGNVPPCSRSISSSLVAIRRCDHPAACSCRID